MEATEAITQSISPWNTCPQQQASTSPWGKKADNVPCSLEDVMSEQLATDLQKKEYVDVELEAGSEVEPEILDLINMSNAEEDTSSDVVLARMLQMQYDQEYNQQIRAEEQHHNGTNKVTVSLDNFKSPHPAFRDDEEWSYQDSQIDEETPSVWEREPAPSFKNKGYTGKGKNIRTKHDAVICGRKNASKLMDFPPEFESGDGEGMDMKLPNHVYNKLKRHSDAESKRSQRLHEKKEHSTAEHAMDPRTRLLLYKQVNNGRLESISGSISTGKESVVFHAYGGEYNGTRLEREVAIKVFKTTLNEFKNRERYVHGDHRFSKDDYKKFNPRKIIGLWAMKETANLNRMRKFDVPCPKVQLLKKHVLVMSFLGKDGVPAPKLKDAKLSYANLDIAYDQVLEILKKIYRECGLVHADLSEYNMLWFRERVYVIDVSQAVDKTHPFALEFLHRDCTNVAKFFKSKGVQDVMTPEQMFNAVTQLDIQGRGADFIAQVQRYAKEKREELLAHQASTKEYPFDYFFERSLQEKTILPSQVALSESEGEDEVEVILEEEKEGK